MPRRPDLPCASCGKLIWRGRTSAPAGVAQCQQCRRDFIPHGTQSGYSKGCRCDECRSAKSTAMREYAARIKATEGVSLKNKYRKKPSPVHCVDCGVHLACGVGPRSDPKAPTCKPCGIARSAARLRAAAFRRRALRVANASARGSSGAGAWVQGECTNCGAYFVRKGAASDYCTSACRRMDRPSGQFVTRSRRVAIYLRDNWTCQICQGTVDPNLHHGDDWAASLDHIVPRSRGGSHDETNLRLAHRWCNSVRGDESYYSDSDLAA
jgi:hypothetical protein